MYIVIRITFPKSGKELKSITQQHVKATVHDACKMDTMNSFFSLSFRLCIGFKHLTFYLNYDNESENWLP